MVNPAELHAAQVKYWNGAGGARWLAQRDRRERTRTAFADVLMNRAAAALGETVLDVGCGLGDTSIWLAERVGPTGRVLAADVSAQLLAGARDRLAPYPWAEALHADAATFAFPQGEFDLLFSRFGVMFFGDPVTAFANLRTALKPRGRVCFACWEKNMSMTAVDAARRLLPDLPKPDPDAPGPLSLARPERITHILTEAGFAPPSFEKIAVTIDAAAGEGLDAAVTQTLQSGPAARLLEGQPDDVMKTIAAAVREALEPYEDNGTVNLPAAFWIVKTEITGG
jgi:SAM-dependent methyltransferase